MPFPGATDESGRPLTSVSHENIASPRFPGDIANVDTTRAVDSRTPRSVARRSKSLPDHAGFRGIREQRLDEKKPDFDEDQEDQMASEQNASTDLCARCRRINAETLSSGDEFVLAESLNDVLSSCAECVLCDLVAREVQFFRPELYASPLMVSVVIRPCRQGALVYGWQILAGRTNSNPEEEYCRLTLRVSYLEGDPAATILPGLRRRAVGVNTASRQSSVVARKWLTDCEHWHEWLDDKKRRPVLQLRSDPVDEATARPSRLIDCFADLPSNVAISETTAGRQNRCRLVEGISKGVPYVALSYCWGRLKKPDWLTIEENLAARLCFLDERNLPKTLIDAVEITRSLHIRYLWVDCLCILQDSKKDWLLESGKMGAIFTNAFVTVCALDSEGSHSGIYNCASTSGDPEILAQMSVSSNILGGRRSVLQLTLEDLDSTHGNFKPNQDNILATRIWCYQEALLSRRKLYYTDRQLYWSCPHLSQSEDRLYHEWFPSHPLSGRFPPSISWYYQIVERDYSERKASNVSDRLIALSGIARRVSLTMGSRYLAGIWQSSLELGLSWRAIGPTNVAWASLHDQYRAYSAPSWSWASLESEVWFRRDSGVRTRHCTFVDAQMQLASEDPFGAVTRGSSLTLRSALFRGCVQEQKHWLEVVMEDAVWMIAKSDGLPLQERDVLGLLIATSRNEGGLLTAEATMILLDPTPVDGCFTRVGLGELCIWREEDGRLDEWQKLLDKTPDTDVTII